MWFEMPRFSRATGNFTHCPTVSAEGSERKPMGVERPGPGNIAACLISFWYSVHLCHELA